MSVQYKFKFNYCCKCYSEIGDDKECECGCRNIVYSNSLKIENNRIKCGCGSDEMKMVSHINCNPYYYHTYQCTHCNNAIGYTCYYESPYL
jgi:hypothetical protein